MRNEKVAELIEKIKALPEFNTKYDDVTDSVEFGAVDSDEWIGISDDNLTPEEIAEYKEEYGSELDLNKFYLYEGGMGDLIGDEYKFSVARQQFYTKDFPAISSVDILKKVKDDLRDYWTNCTG